VSCRGWKGRRGRTAHRWTGRARRQARFTGRGAPRGRGFVGRARTGLLAGALAAAPCWWRQTLAVSSFGGTGGSRAAGASDDLYPRINSRSRLSDRGGSTYEKSDSGERSTAAGGRLTAGAAAANLPWGALRGAEGPASSISGATSGCPRFANVLRALVNGAPPRPDWARARAVYGTHLEAAPREDSHRPTSSPKAPGLLTRKGRRCFGLRAARTRRGLIGRTWWDRPPSRGGSPAPGRHVPPTRHTSRMAGARTNPCYKGSPNTTTPPEDRRIASGGAACAPPAGGSAGDEVAVLFQAHLGAGSIRAMLVGCYVHGRTPSRGWRGTDERPSELTSTPTTAEPPSRVVRPAPPGTARGAGGRTSAACSQKATPPQQPKR